MIMQDDKLPTFFNDQIYFSFIDFVVDYYVKDHLWNLKYNLIEKPLDCSHQMLVFPKKIFIYSLF